MELNILRADPAGNITIFVLDQVEKAQRAAIAEKIMAIPALKAEQVGYVCPAEDDADGHMEMMGGEFCGNATMSMAAWLHRELPVGAERALTLPVSGAPQPVACRVTRIDGCFIGTVAMPLPERIEQLSLPVGGVMQTFPVVHLPGICHVIAPAEVIDRARAEETLRSWSKLLSGEAMGLLLLEESQTAFTPLVYVKPTDSCVWERGCGSGSAAVGCYLAHRTGAPYTIALQQPGGIIEVRAGWQNGRVHALSITGEVHMGASGSLTLPLNGFFSQL